MCARLNEDLNSSRKSISKRPEEQSLNLTVYRDVYTVSSGDPGQLCESIAAKNS